MTEYDTMLLGDYNMFELDPTNIVGGGATSLLIIISMWILFKKANERGWASLIPFYNVYTLFKVVYGNGWKFLLLLIPLYNLILAIQTQFRLGKVFGKSTGFGCGLLFLPVIFMPILAFGDSKYIGPQN